MSKSEGQTTRRHEQNNLVEGASDNRYPICGANEKISTACGRFSIAHGVGALVRQRDKKKAVYKRVPRSLDENTISTTEQ